MQILRYDTMRCRNSRNICNNNDRSKRHIKHCHKRNDNFRYFRDSFQFRRSRQGRHKVSRSTQSSTRCPANSHCQSRSNNVCDDSGSKKFFTADEILFTCVKVPIPKRPTPAPKNAKILASHLQFFAHSVFNIVETVLREHVRLCRSCDI